MRTLDSRQLPESARKAVVAAAAKHPATMVRDLCERCSLEEVPLRKSPKPELSLLDLTAQEVSGLLALLSS
jgi:hypothetical protein